MTNEIAITLTLYGEAAKKPLEDKLRIAGAIMEMSGGDSSKVEQVCLAFPCWRFKKPFVPNDMASRKNWRECKAIANETIAKMK
jgi:hypothetical protein